MATFRIITTDTPDGAFHMIIDQADIVRASGYGTAINLVQRLDPTMELNGMQQIPVHPYQQQLADYYNGDTTALAQIPHRQDGTEFQKKVWHAMSTIPYGKTMSYKMLAEASGSASAIRAAGTICGLNRLILLIPCHRIIKSDGTIGSYLYGTVIKQSLLDHEKAIR